MLDQSGEAGLVEGLPLTLTALPLCERALAAVAPKRGFPLEIVHASSSASPCATPYLATCFASKVAAIMMIAWLLQLGDFRPHERRSTGCWMSEGWLGGYLFNGLRCWAASLD